MNREIKFRGKNKDIGWVEGQVAYDLNEDTYIIREVEQDSSYGLEEAMLFAIMWYRVDKETIGQYTGLKDENGKEIYEGDIAKYENMIGKIMFFNGSFILSDFEETEEWELGVINEELETMGNIYESELLGGEDE